MLSTSFDITHQVSQLDGTVERFLKKVDGMVLRKS